jgi:light-regulated signal transduction histidine kinase (bacteriophytochrome)
VEAGKLPRVPVREVHLEQLFQNLISNAIKYRSDKRPTIRVDAFEDGPDWTFSVSDNGIGIDPRYSHQIFGVFKRLHRADEYDGAGIGLAICHRIVERYGGRIWVESKAGEGSTFFFTLPGGQTERRGIHQ